MDDNYEIEIKYLLRDFNKNDFTTKFFKENFNDLNDLISKIKLYGNNYSQYYLNSSIAKIEAKKRKISNPSEFKTIRIRKIEYVSKDKNKIEYILTLKSKTDGLKRREYEYQLKKEEFDIYLRKSKFGIKKKRFLLVHPQNSLLNIEFDLFLGNKEKSLNNIILAEVEADSESKLKILSPLGLDVSNNFIYSNSSLAKLNKK